MGGEEEEAELCSVKDSSKRKLDEIQLIKQKAQEFVARVEDYSNPDAQKLLGQMAENSQSGLAPFATQLGSQYGSQGTSKRIDIPNGKVGVIIGKAGETIKYLQLQSGARIQVAKDTEVDLYSQTRAVELLGTAEQISRAEQLIKDVMAETDAGGSGSSVARGLNSVPQGAEQFVMKVPNNKVAMVIGKGGETIKNMQSKSGARIQVIPLHLPPGDTSTERNVHINGTKEQIESAKGLVNEVISQIRVRNPSLGNSQMQQAYYPPGNWVPPAQTPLPQPGYGYTQPGAYPTPPLAYHGSYPPQPAGWDQSNPSARPPQPSTGYNYYGQQDQTGSTPSNINSSYDQAQITSQNYEVGFSHQPQSYGQVTPAQVPQHDEQKTYFTSGNWTPVASSQFDGVQSSSQPPTYQVTYSQSPVATQAVAYGPCPSYTSPLPPYPGYDQTGYTQSGHGGQPSVYPQLPVQSQPPTSQPVYGQAGYPPQPPPVQSNYFQATPVYGQTRAGAGTAAANNIYPALGLWS